MFNENVSMQDIKINFTKSSFKIRESILHFIICIHLWEIKDFFFELSSIPTLGKNVK